MNQLHRKIQRQRQADKVNDRYYEGLQNIGNLGIAIPPDIQPFAFPLNWCRTYVDVLTERQDVRLILRQGATTEDEELRKDWEANDLDTESTLAHLDLLVYGRSFISVAADPDGDRPLIRVESPTDMAAIVDPRTRKMLGALRVYSSDTGSIRCATLYTPNSTILLDYTAAAMWKVTQRIEHNLGRVPIVMMLNRRRAGKYTWESQLNDLKQIVDMAGRVLLQLQLAMETVGTPQKVFIGATKKDFVDNAGKPLDEWEAYLGAIVALSNKDAKVAQLASADLSGFHETIKMLAEQASTVTGMPVRMMGQNTANPAAEGSIRADESRLVKQVERLNTTAGAGWAWALGIAERIRTRRWDADGKIKIEWHNPGTPTESQRADALQKLTGGKPIMSRRGAQNEMGWSQPRIDQEQKWLDQEESLGINLESTLL